MPLLNDHAVRVLIRDHVKYCGRLVAARRGLLGMSQQQVADLAGITQPAVSYIELGARVPRDHVKVMIASALGCTVGDLWPHPDGQRIAAILSEVAA